MQEMALAWPRRLFLVTLWLGTACGTFGGASELDDAPNRSSAPALDAGARDAGAPLDAASSWVPSDAGPEERTDVAVGPARCTLDQHVQLDFTGGVDNAEAGWRRTPTLTLSAEGLRAQHTPPPEQPPSLSCVLDADANGMSFATGVRIVYVVALESPARYCCDTYPLLAVGDDNHVAQLTVGSAGRARFSKLGETILTQDFGSYDDGEKVILSLQIRDGKTFFCGDIVRVDDADDGICRQGDLRERRDITLPPTLRALELGLPRNGEGIATISRSLRIGFIPP